MPTNQDLNPNGGVQGTSPLYRFGTSPNTRSVLSQKCRVLTPAYGGDSAVMFQMGVLGSFTLSESKTVEAIRGIGFGDQVAELVPGVTEPQSISFSRSLLYLSNIWQATGYAGGVSGPVRSLKHHRWPFDIRQEVVFSTIADQEFSNGDTPTAGTGFTAGVGTVDYSGALGGSSVTNQTGTHNILITYYEGCWWTSWGATFEKDSALITEDGDCMVTDIHDDSTQYGEFIATGNDPTNGQFQSQIYSGAFGGDAPETP